MRSMVMRGIFLSVALLVALGGCKPAPDDVPVIGDDVVFALGTWGAGGSEDACLKKFDKDGAEDVVNWNTFMADGTLYCEHNVMDIDSSGSLYIAYMFMNGTSGYDWRIRKFNASGTEDTVNWFKAVAGGMNNGHDSPTALAVDSSNNVYVAGYFRDGIDGMVIDWSIKKYSAGGTEITTGWNKIITGDAAVSPDIIDAIALDSDDNLYVLGTLYTSAGRRLVIKKFSSAGVEDTTNWNKVITGNSLVCLAVDPDDNLYVGGDDADDFWIKKYSPDGVEDAVNWDKSVDVNLADTVQAMATDSSGNLYIAGTFSNGSDSNWCIKKFTSGGTEITTGWNKQFDSTGEDWLGSIAVGGHDEVYIFGLFEVAANNHDWAILKYAPDGTEDTVNWDKDYAADAVNSSSGVSILVDY